MVTPSARRLRPGFGESVHQSFKVTPPRLAQQTMKTPLAGKVALVAGATRGAGRGIAVQLGAAGATVYVTGRTTRSERSEMGRPETIEETAALVDEAGARGLAVRVDHLVPDEVSALVTRIKNEQGRLPDAWRYVTEVQDAGKPADVTGYR